VGALSARGQPLSAAKVFIAFPDDILACARRPKRGDAARLRAVMAAPTSAKRDRAGIQKNYANDRCIRL